MASACPNIEPPTTTTSATSSTFTPSRCSRGSCPATSGARHNPVASHDVAIQSMPICTCHVRASEYGTISDSGKP